MFEIESALNVQAGVVRMALIKSSHGGSAVANAIILDLGDLARQGQLLRERAREQADEIVAQAHEERERIVAGADTLGQKQGFEKGFDEGMAKGREEGHAEAKREAAELFNAVTTRWSRAIDEFEAAREQMLLDARHEVIAFAGVVAERVTKRVIELDDRVVAEQMEAVLRRVSKPSRLVITISPRDEAVARETLPGLIDRLSHVSHAQLVIDPELGDGSCIACTSGGGEIDASIDKQIERVLSVLLPSNGSEPGS